MSDAYTLFREGQKRLRTGMAAQATVPLERAKRLEPEQGVDPRSARDRLLPPRALGETRSASSARSSRSSRRPTTTRTTRSAGRSSSWGGPPRRTATTSSPSSMDPGSETLRRPHPRPRRPVRAVVQRVARASAAPGGSIGAGLCILLGIADGDDRPRGRAAGREGRAPADLRERGRAGSTARSSTRAAPRSSSASSR